MKHYHEHHTTIIEHRAPTDESIKLYGEMYEKAKASLIRTVHVKDNLVKGVLLLFQVHTFSKYQCVFKFSINGHEYEVADEIGHYEFDNKVMEMTLKTMVRENAAYMVLIQLFFDVLFKTLLVPLAPDLFQNASTPRARGSLFNDFIIQRDYRGYI